MIILRLILAALFIAAHAKAQFGTPPPYSIDIEPVGSPVPGIHSFAFAQSGSKWLIVGGRTNGLHGFSSNDGFPTMYANNDIVVIDTVNWQYWTSSLSALPYNIADPLRSTNMQFYEDSTYLYMTGGFGFDSILYGYVTFPTLTAIHIGNTINAVIAGTPLAPHIRQITNPAFQVCGGEMHKMGNEYYLVMGHDFSGYYTNPPSPWFTQIYTNQIRSFEISDDGINLSISNLSNVTDTTNFHRRDLNVFPLVNPNGSFSLGCYGGVFRYNINLPYLNPVYIHSAGPVTDAYSQLMSHYTCAGITLFDSVTRQMHTTFLGGIGLYDFNHSTNTMNIDSLVPFISDISTLTRHPDGSSQEYVHPVQLPGLLGSNAEFIPNLALPHYANGVLKFRDLPNQRILAGYMYGGIRATNPNISPSIANDTVYRVYLIPDSVLSGTGTEPEILSIFIYPNPSSSQAAIHMKLSGPVQAEVVLRNMLGQEIISRKNIYLGSGAQLMHLDIGKLKSGQYLLSFRTDHEHRVLRILKSE